MIPQKSSVDVRTCVGISIHASHLKLQKSNHSFETNVALNVSGTPQQSFTTLFGHADDYPYFGLSMF